MVYVVLAGLLIGAATRVAPSRTTERPDGSRRWNDHDGRRPRRLRVRPSPEGGVAALQGLTLDVREGEIYVVLGPSGSGKSTLVRIVAGFDRPWAGSVSVAGVDLRAWLSVRGMAGCRIPAARLHRPRRYWRALGRRVTQRAPRARLPPAARARGSCCREERDGRASCWSASASATGSTQDPGSCPVGSSSGSRCARRSLIARASSSPTGPAGELDVETASGVLALHTAELECASGRPRHCLVGHDPATIERADRVDCHRPRRTGQQQQASSPAAARKPS